MVSWKERFIFQCLRYLHLTWLHETYQDIMKTKLVYTFVAVANNVNASDYLKTINNTDILISILHG